ncbi:EboA domain-containing protein [filamentous cyanobacterium LEGE 11480]|uniref:EboA domain-containing protein n=1 Tax=Romeriopsis navalis LEGE 11480 TaxID=2777977 RepID=A0A928VI92_9CYAN|nr:EboA domain-containing protein [Romeriopsis navalis]MBE9028815.1 EboA domain-containing protein [Romeriopsis navalis LEGE 11480]
MDMLVDTAQLRLVLSTWLAENLPSESWQWLSQQVQAVEHSASDRTLFTTFSLITRRVGKADLCLNAAQFATAQTLCPGWEPQRWSVDQAARSWLLLHLPQADELQVKHRIEQLFTTSGLQELIALHQTLPLLPYPDRYRFWADEGVRSHMKGVFDAIVLRNAYPTQHFDQDAWNQMVLKTLFVESELQPIYGFDGRRNAQLARMAIDYVHERWAAKRRITPELWRLVAPYIDDLMLVDLKAGLAMDDLVQREAIGLCCVESQLPAAIALLAPYPGLVTRVAAIDWGDICARRSVVMSADPIAV